ncbi:DinB family protein [Mucilaginibacter robiniae]|uniref:DinB family protein n=1 Tax=Mucilaginibacter robiniae TaxID=2728022 RepID=A0A7L5DXZ3_9SPHI|nr:DinB family protein [Mucilaginibacter robiniae]QJD94899.1 DinB family protein [Mucilaginibacter robiniae]
MINQPQPDEYAPFYANYISLASQGNTIETLTRLKDSTYNFFISLPAGKGDFAYAEGKWTIKEVLGHLIDSERIFAYRTLRFIRNDQTNLPGFDQDLFVTNAHFNERDLNDLALEFKTVRESNLYFFRTITEPDSLKTGLANGNIISVRALLYIAAGHELHHLHILNERYL